MDPDGCFCMYHICCTISTVFNLSLHILRCTQSERSADVHTLANSDLAPTTSEMNKPLGE